MRRAPFLVLALLIAAGMAKAQANFNFTGYTVDNLANGVTTGDFNRDGRPDFAVTNGDSVTVFLATTLGHFPATGVSYPGLGSPGVIRAADVNNDGKLDLVFTNGPMLSVLLGNGDGTFHRGVDIPTTYTAYDFDLGDLNHDGNVDIALIECDSNAVCDMRAELGHGNATFTAGYKIQMTSYAANIALRDMDGDGNLDVILTRSPDVLLFGGDGTGRFPVFTKFRPPAVCNAPELDCKDGLWGLAVADFNNDGRLDFAVLQVHSCGTSCDWTDLYGYKNNGSGFSFTQVSDVSSGSSGGTLLAGDFNGDGNMDLINTDSFYANGGSAYFQGAGNLTFQGHGSNLPFPGFAGPVTRDMNLDSRHDVLLSVGSDNTDSSVLDVGLNSGGYTNCKPPSSANLAAKICTPLSNVTTSSPVLIRASGNSPAGISRLELWVDGVKKYQKWNDQLAKKITLSSGGHRVVVVAVDQYKGSAKSVITVNVP